MDVDSFSSVCVRVQLCDFSKLLPMPLAQFMLGNCKPIVFTFGGEEEVLPPRWSLKLEILGCLKTSFYIIGALCFTSKDVSSCEGDCIWLPLLPVYDGVENFVRGNCRSMECTSRPDWSNNFTSVQQNYARNLRMQREIKQGMV